MNWGEQGITALLTFVLAHILGPREFGIVAIAAIYLLFIQLFLDQGFGPALIQRKNLKDEHLDSVFWGQFIVSLLLAGVSIGLSSWWSRVNHEPLLALVISVLSLSIPIQGLTVVQTAVLKRRMDFGNLAIRTNVATLTGGMVGVVLALLQFGVWSLVAQQLAGSLMGLILLWGLSHWRPRLRFSWRHFRELFHFASGSFAGRLAVFVNNRSDALLMGLFCGPLAVGLYRLADRLMNQLLSVTTRSLTVVALPHFAEAQNDPAELKRRVLSCIHLSALLTIPAMAWLAAASELILRVVGSKWEASARVLMLLCAVGVVQAITLFTGPLLQAVGRPYTIARITWILAAVNLAGLAVIGSLMRSAPVSRQILAVAVLRVCVFGLIYTPINMGLARHVCGIHIRDLAGVLRSSAVCGGTIIGLIVTLSRLPIVVCLGPILRLVVTSGVALAAGMILMLWLEPRIRGQARTVWLHMTKAPNRKHGVVALKAEY